ncbi:MAG TPA: oxidoreductase [Deltaproteobacteria bacterium]|jgi:predicted dehydrogenase|nr:oxidoreductase [Deltaproteobacteria bacterium]|tara:strand:+ start:17249 stop:18355 length:1107 start_codon:yes stop_codon:yes gene_type:complete
MSKIRVGIAGTSWWADAMYLPALGGNPHVEVVAACGRNPQRAEAFAQKWKISQHFVDFKKMLDQAELDALIVSTGNDTHAPFTVAALERGIPVLCEKPLGLNYAEALEMTKLAQKTKLVNLVPFTYSFMPTARYLKRLIDQGYIGKPYHCNLRYYTGYRRKTEYTWRLNAAEAGSGALGDIGSHFIYLAQWMMGSVSALSCRLGSPIDRPDTTPDGKPFTHTDDTAMVMLEFANGAQGMIHATTICYEDSPFGQTHHMEFHGSEGTLYSVTDWDKIQRVHGAQVGEGLPHELPIPDDIWGKARRDTVHNTYRDVFRQDGHMIGDFIEGVRTGQAVRPDFAVGTDVQRILDAALLSHQEGRRVLIEEIQ